ncbi:MAG: hypothetical protein ABW090_16110 [Sedimenticola sp.]
MKTRTSVKALESLGDWAMYHMAPIEGLIEKYREEIMEVMKRRKEFSEYKKRNPAYKTPFKKYRYPNGDVAWRGRRVRPDGMTYDPVSGGLVSVGLSPHELVVDAERNVGARRNQPKRKVITSETVKGLERG